MTLPRAAAPSLVLSLFAALSACWGGSSGGGESSTFGVGGTVSGVVYSGVGPQLIIFENGGDAVEHPANGAFTFSQKLAQGASYNITLQTSLLHPVQNCAVQNGSGVAGPSSANAVSVVCTTVSFSVGGSVSGPTGSGLVLSNAGTALPVSADGPFSFSLASGSQYNVTVTSQPTNPAATCTVENGTGLVTNAAVSNIAVICQPNLYSIGGVVSGLQGAGLTLTLNGSNPLPIAANGSFTFQIPAVASGATYLVSASAQPTGTTQTCVVPNGVGTVASSSVTTINVHCSMPRFAYGPGGHGNDVLAYSVTFSNGALTPIPGGPFSAGDTTAAVALDPGYRFLFAANEGATFGPGSNTVSAYTIDATTGALTAVTGSPFSSVPAPVDLAVDLSGRFLYVANLHNNTVNAFSISASGSLTAIVGGSSEGGRDGPRHLTMHPSGKFLYLSVGNEATVWAYGINAISGALTAVSGSPFATFAGPSPVVISPDGLVAYFVDTDEADTETNFSDSMLDPATGAFTLGPYPPAVISTPGYLGFNLLDAFALDAEGRTGYVTGRNAHPANDTIEPVPLCYACAQTSAPNVPLSAQVSWMSADPSGRFLYVIDVSGNALAYLIDRSTGQLTAGATTAQAFVPGGSAVITSQ